MEKKNHNIRFNLDNEEARKAWECLHSYEVEEDFKSLNAFVNAAINDYYERHLQKRADSYFETREKEDAFAERMVQLVEQKVLANLPALAGIEESKVSVDDYEAWQEEPEASVEDISVYQAFDEFMESENIPENDTDVFYGGAFHEFHKKWQGIATDEVAETDVDYTKLSMKERAELLPPPTDDTMEEFEQFKNRMGYSDKKMRSVRYKMEVYDDFLKEYDYRKKIKGMQKLEQRDKTIKKNRDSR